MTIGWWRHRKGRGHLMMPLADAKLMSRCEDFIILKPDRPLPLVLPAGWSACKRCMRKI